MGRVTSTVPTRAPADAARRQRYLYGLSQPTREGVVAAAVALGALGVMYMWWHDTSPASVYGPGPWLTAAGRVTGLLGTYLVVIEVLLMGRVPWLDRMIGMDRLAVWHRRNGEYSICLLVAHALLIIWGYAVTTHDGLLSETKSVVLSYPDMLAATVGLGLLVLIGVLSARAVRKRVQLSHLVLRTPLHLHRPRTFLRPPVQHRCRLCDAPAQPGHLGRHVRDRCCAPDRSTASSRPCSTWPRHRFVVVGTASEGPGLTSVYVSGRELEQAGCGAGQFFLWRFLTRDGWWQAHPFSLSAAPNGRWFRMTVKALGDHSSGLARLRPGTKVLLEGPFGDFTDAPAAGAQGPDDRCRRRHNAAAGHVRGGAPRPPGDMTLMYRASNSDELGLRAELDEIAQRRGAKVHYLVGPRDEHPEYLTPDHLQRLVRDVVQRDIYVCGPPGFTATVNSSLRALCASRGATSTPNCSSCRRTGVSCVAP